MKKVETFPWDPAEHLTTDEMVIGYLEAALEENDTMLLAAALNTIARAKGVIKPDGDNSEIFRILTQTTKNA